MTTYALKKIAINNNEKFSNLAVCIQMAKIGVNQAPTFIKEVDKLIACGEFRLMKFSFLFIFIFIFLTRRKALDTLIHKASNYPDLLVEIPCLVEIFFVFFGFVEI